MMSITQMIGPADLIILSVILLSMLNSFIQGFISQLFSLLTWVAGFWLAMTFSETFAGYFLATHIQTPSIRIIAAFAIILVVALVAGGIFEYLLSMLIHKTGLSSMDRFLGMFFGLVKGVLVVSIVLLLARMTPLSQDHWWQDSYLIPKFQPIEKTIRELMKNKLPKVFEQPVLEKVTGGIQLDAEDLV